MGRSPLGHAPFPSPADGLTRFGQRLCLVVYPLAEGGDDVTAPHDDDVTAPHDDVTAPHGDQRRPLTSQPHN